jgi:GTPase SAR1 family protein
MRRLSISTGDAFILVYSVDDESTFEQVERLRDEIIAEKKGDQRTPIVIVGNKTDVGKDKRRVSLPTAETTASIDWGTGYVEVSRSVVG